MERIPSGIYTQEFRKQAVKLVETEGLPIKEAARRLSLPVGSLKIGYMPHVLASLRQMAVKLRNRFSSFSENQRTGKTVQAQ